MQGAILFLLGASLLATANCATGQPNEDFSSLQYAAIVVLVSLMSGGLGFIYYDRRNGYRIISRVWGQYNQLKLRLVDLKKRIAERKKKIVFEEAPQSSKGTMDVFDSQKTFSEAEMNSMQDATPTPNQRQGLSGMEIVEDTSKVNLKDVFQNKEIAGRNQKRSKSKLKGKVIYKKDTIDENVEQSLQLTEQDESTTKTEQS